MSYPFFIIFQGAEPLKHQEPQPLPNPIQMEGLASWEAINRSANLRCASAMGWYLGSTVSTTAAPCENEE